MKIFKRNIVVSAIAVGALSLTACSSPNEEPVTEGSSAKESSVASSTESSAAGTTESSAAKETTSKSAQPSLTAEDIHLHDAVVRAMDADSDMTAIFGEIENHSAKAVTLVGFTTSANAKMNQIHEVTNGAMKEKEGGISIPADEDFELEPGGYHLMLMGLDKPLMAGETIDLTLKFDDGSEVEIADIPVRNIGAGAEGYDDMEGMDHDDRMDHDDKDHDDKDHHDKDHDDKYEDK